MEKQIRSICDNIINYQWQCRYGINAPKKERDGWHERVQGFLKDTKNNYSFIEMKNGRILNFVVIKKIKSLNHKDVFFIVVCELEKKNQTKTYFKKLLQDVKKHFRKKKINFRIEVFKGQNHLKKLVQESSFRIWGNYLKGDVEKVHARLSKKSFKHLEEEYEIRQTAEMKDFKEMMDLEFASHRSDRSSIVHHFRRSDFNSFMGIFKIISKAKSSFAIYHDGKRVAQIMINPKLSKSTGAAIATIAVHPKHQRKGLALWLYQKAVQYMKKNRKKVFFGHTTSKGVLKNAKKMGRVPIAHIYEKTI